MLHNFTDVNVCAELILKLRQNTEENNLSAVSIAGRSAYHMF